jgi:ribosomal protein S18 acetylase RimI-like enzyme
MHIRFAKEEDAKSLAEAIGDVEQSGFMLFNPNERQVTEEGAEKLISLLSKQPNAIIVAVEEQHVLGYLFVKGETPERVKHRASVAVVGVIESARNRGIAQKLFDFMEALMKERKIRRLQISVMATNERAIHVYEKMGFVKEGVYKDALYIGHNYIDEVVLAKIIKE